MLYTVRNNNPPVTIPLNTQAPLSQPPIAAQDYLQQPDAGARELAHIPGDWGLPLLGAAVSMVRDQLGLARRHYQRYGELSRIQVALQKGVLALGPDLAEQIMLDPEQNFSSKMAYKWTLEPYFGERYLLGNDFAEHKFQRSVMQSGFKADAMRGYVEVLNRAFARGIEQWDVSGDFRFYDNIKHLLLETSLEVFFGVRSSSDIAPRLSKAFIDVTVGQLGLFHVDLPGFKFHVGQKARRLLREYVGQLLPQRRQGDGTDMLSYMARERKPDGSLFSDDELIDHACFLLFAAHDTSTSTLTHVMYYLARDAILQQQVREELAGAGGEVLAYDNINQLPLLEAVSMECQRLHCAAQVIVRRNIRPCKLGGYELPANTLVFQFPAFSHRMGEYWSDPESFDPERFNPGRAEHKRHPFAYMPFGGGAHKCIGMHFAAMQANLFCHQFLRRYRFGLPEHYRAEFVTLPLPKLKDDLPLRIAPL